MRCLVPFARPLLPFCLVLALGVGSGCTSCGGMGGMDLAGQDDMGLDLAGLDLAGLDLADLDQRPPDRCERSADCPERVSPICDRSTSPAMCRPCQNDGECGARDPGLKRCIEGGCYACLSSNDCSGERGCRAGACVDCEGHGDCASGVCDPYQMNGAGRYGRCVPQSSLLYVDNRNGGACTSGDGTSPEQALCTLAEGLAALRPPRQALRVMRSTASYGLLRLHGSATLYGPGGPEGSPDRAMLGGDYNRDAVWLQSDGTSEPQLILDGFEIVGGNQGVRCTGLGDGPTMKRPTLRLRRSVVRSMRSVGLYAHRCIVEIDRARFANNGEGGIDLDFVEYSVTNTFVLDNTFGGGGVTFMGGAGLKPDGSRGQAVFRYNTLLRNSPRAVDCRGQSLEDSIVFDNAGGTNQFRGECRLTRVVVGDKEMGVSGAGAIKQNPMLDAGGRLQRGDTVCVDQGGAPVVRTDHFGTPRPQGMGPDIGAHELR